MTSDPLEELVSTTLEKQFKREEELYKEFKERYPISLTYSKFDELNKGWFMPLLHKHYLTEKSPEYHALKRIIEEYEKDELNKEKPKMPEGMMVMMGNQIKH